MDGIESERRQRERDKRGDAISDTERNRASVPITERNDAAEEHAAGAGDRVLHLAARGDDGGNVGRNGGGITADGADDLMERGRVDVQQLDGNLDLVRPAGASRVQHLRALRQRAHRCHNPILSPTPRSVLICHSLWSPSAQREPLHDLLQVLPRCLLQFGFLQQQGGVEGGHHGYAMQLHPLAAILCGERLVGLERGEGGTTKHDDDLRLCDADLRGQHGRQRLTSSGWGRRAGVLRHFTTEVR